MCAKDCIYLFADAVRKIFPETTEAAMVHDISSWLSSARDRDGGRQKRAEKGLDPLRLICITLICCGCVMPQREAKSV